MAHLTQRIEIARRVLASFDELNGQSPSKILRDAAIQRFEYTFEALWKAAQSTLLDRYGVQANSPKPVIRACFENGMLTEAETRLALTMVDHRNLTSHTYNETLADEIFAALPDYRRLMRTWLEALANG